ncbi:peroxiredoxin [Flavobacterium sp. 270]|uniref:peroxiredoxin family protein n=1 Tax=Flavobacterium sp. 270 TaxID=2512114 RepID=UPI00106536C6|nr:TlpA disulfide reductase family protein [Flavobacterium sp. 270]TDW47388.1 peroxiredoxin [Flavobacterium sp. 270]
MKTRLLFFCFLFAGAVQAQSVTLHFADQPNAPVHIDAHMGLQTDILVKATLDGSGSYTFKPGAQYAPGMWVVSVGKQEGVEFIWNGSENLTIDGDSKGIKIINSPENDNLRTWGQQQMKLADKLRLCETGMQVYAGEKSKQQFFITENKILQQQAAKFNGTLSKSKLYAASFIRYIAMEQFGQAIAAPVQDKKLCEPFYNSFKDSTDLTKLYTSGHWFNVINTALGLYRKAGNGLGEGLHRKDFPMDMIYMLASTRNDETFKVFGNDILMICEQFGWDAERDHILNYIVASERVKQPTPFMQKLYDAQVYKIGSPASDIALNDGSSFFSQPASQYLLLFFKSDCDHCQHEIAALKEQYETLKSKGVAVLTVSADTDDMVNKTYSNAFPWQHVCDLKGMSGPDFGNYGVVGTPTIFIIDKDKKIAGRYAGIAEIMAKLQ